YLRRSGRVSWARAGLGNLLQLKQLVGLYGGQVQSLERVRTRSRSLDQLVEHVRALGQVERLAVLHANAPQEAAALCARCAELVRDRALPVVNVTPVIGTHVGPGAVGVAVVQSTSVMN